MFIECSQRTGYEQGVYITRILYEQRLMTGNVHTQTLNEHYTAVHECS